MSIGRSHLHRHAALREARLLQILKRPSGLPVDIRISRQASRLKLSQRAHTRNPPLLSVFEHPLTGSASFLKSVMDRSLASPHIVLLSPLLFIAALGRSDSKGPDLLRQRRFGFNNEFIEICKFPSIYVDLSEANAVRFVSKGDPRVIRVWTRHPDDVAR